MHDVTTCPHCGLSLTAEPAVADVTDGLPGLHEFIAPTAWLADEWTGMVPEPPPPPPPPPAASVDADAQPWLPAAISVNEDARPWTPTVLSVDEDAPSWMPTAEWAQASWLDDEFVPVAKPEPELVTLAAPDPVAAVDVLPWTPRHEAEQAEVDGGDLATPVASTFQTVARAPLTSAADIDAVFSAAFASPEPEYEPVADSSPAAEAAPTPAPAELAPAASVATASPVEAAAGAAEALDAGTAARRGWSIRGADEVDDAASPDGADPRSLASGRRAAASSRSTTATGSRQRRRLSRGARLLVTANALIVLGVATWLGFSSGGFGNLLHPAHLTQPSSIGSLARVTDASATQLVQGLQAQLAGSNTGVAAVYGSSGTPQLVFVAYQGKAATQTAEQLTQAVNASSTPFSSAPLVSTVAGQQYVCGRVASAGAAPSVLCAWTDASAAGFIVTINSTDVSGALTLAAQARAAAEG